jgi:hypothetical protein
MATVAGRGTHSFFSDRESSIGNTFTAGSIDLRVDNTTHYNGLVCQDGEWVCHPWADAMTKEDQGKRKNGSAVLPDRSDAGVALGVAETNGAASDSPVVTGSFYSLGFGGSIVLRFNNLILNGSGDDIRVYEVTGGSYPDEKATIEASQDGVTWTLLGTATRDEDFDLGALSWAAYVRITDTSAPGAFEPTADGFDLDAVKALHCGSDPDLSGESCDGLSWTETNLETGVHRFFDFDDIKPGDRGEDTVSLHISDNDAWGRMVIDVTKDTDNTCTSSEETAEDNACRAPDGPGELRENLDFVVWLDEGIKPGFQGKQNDIGEGDNLKQEGEVGLVSSGSIDADGEIHDIGLGLAAAYTEHGCTDSDGATNYGLCHGLALDGRMVASTTYYFGVGWDLPIDTGNEAQTDIFVSDVSFEVEQYRNNPAPFAP